MTLRRRSARRADAGDDGTTRGKERRDSNETKRNGGGKDEKRRSSRAVISLHARSVARAHRILHNNTIIYMCVINAYTPFRRQRFSFFFFCVIFYRLRTSSRAPTLHLHTHTHTHSQGLSIKRSPSGPLGSACVGVRIASPWTEEEDGGIVAGGRGCSVSCYRFSRFPT